MAKGKVGLPSVLTWYFVNSVLAAPVMSMHPARMGSIASTAIISRQQLASGKRAIEVV